MALHGDREPPDYLPHAAQSWVMEHQAVLEAICDEFIASGEWPDPTDLHRKLRGQGRDHSFSTAISTMPTLLGGRDAWPPQIRLTLFGLGCCPQATELLGLYARTVGLAIEIYDDRSRPNLLSRSMVEEELELTPHQADLLSTVVLADSFFLAGGDANHDRWAQPVDGSAVEFEGVGDSQSFLARLAELRQVGPTVLGVSPAGEGRPGWARRLLRSKSMGRLALHVVGGLIVVAIATAIDLQGGEGGEETGKDPAPADTTDSRADGGAGGGGESKPGKLGTSLRLGCPAPPGPSSRPSVVIQVQAWCALPGVRGQAQLKFKLWVENSSPRPIDIGLGHWYLLVDELDPRSWSPPRIGTTTNTAPARFHVRGQRVWGIPANDDGAYDPIPGQSGTLTFATHWEAEELAPRTSYRPREPGEGDLVFYLPTPRGGVAKSIVGVAYVDQGEVVALCPPGSWGPRLPAASF